MNLRENLRLNSIIQMGAVIAIVALANQVSQDHYTRFDLTENRVHTLSPTAQRLINQLERPLTVKVFFTQGLEAPYNNHERIFLDKLEEFQAWSGGRITIEVVDPTAPEVEVDADGNEQQVTREAEAMRLGVMPIQYRYRDQTRTEVRQVFMGAAFLYGEGHEVLPAITNIGGFEYDIARAIKRLVDPEPKLIGFTIGHGEPDLSTSDGPVEALRNQLSDDNKLLVPVDLSSQQDLLDDIDALLVVGPQSEMSQRELFELDQYIMQGGATGFLISNYIPTPQVEVVALNHGMTDIIANLGVGLNRDLVLDRETNGKLPIPVRRGRYTTQMAVNNPVIPIVSDLSADSPIFRGMDNLTLPFLSSLTIPATSNDIEYSILARSSESSSTSMTVRRIDPYTLGPDSTSGPIEEVGAVPVAVALRGSFVSLFRETGIPDAEPHEDPAIFVRESAPTRSVVIGSTHFVANNVPAMMNLIDWLVQDADLIGIRVKSLQIPSIEPLESGDLRNLKLANLLGPSLLLLLFGVVRSYRRGR